MAKTFMDAVAMCEKENTLAGKMDAISNIKSHHRRLIHEALNKHRRFNVRDWPEPKYSSTDYPIMIPFYELLDKLASRELTGNAARQAVAKVLSMYTKRTAKYLARVILKDLDCGAEAKTWLKAYPEVDLPNFQVMLARKVDDRFKWKFPLIGEVKYDGHRIVAFCNEGVVSYVAARSGRPANFCNGLFDEDLKRLERCLGQPVALDGEVLPDDGFQGTARARGEKNKEDRAALRFYAFDMLPLTEWTLRKCKLKQKERSERLGLLLAEAQAEKIYKSDDRWLNSRKEAEKFFEQVVKHGAPGKDEGLILKDPNALYEWSSSRSGAWTKWKPTATYDLTVKKVVEGKGKYRGVLGALECEGTDENGRKIVASVGGGFDDAQRARFWKIRNLLPGQMIEAEADRMTKAKKSDAWSLRFPRFLRFRTDKE